MNSFDNSHVSSPVRRPLVLGLDLGTTRFKALLFDRSGTTAGHATANVMVARRGNACELPLAEFWLLLSSCVRQALQSASASRTNIAAIAYSSQANSFLLLDDDCRPLTPLILWPDSRAAEQLPKLRQLTGRPDFNDVTGIGFDTPEFCIAKLLWFQQHDPSLWARVRRVQTISDYLVAQLTGEFAGDEGTASLLGIWDLRRHDWWDTALDFVGTTRAQLSTPRRPGTVVGRVHPMGASRLGVVPDIPLSVGTLDHYSAALGAGVHSVEQVSVSIGTVVACVGYSDLYCPLPGCCMGPGTQNHAYYRLTFDANGTGSLDWYRQHFAPEADLATLTDFAQSVPEGADGLMARGSAYLYSGLAGFLNRSQKHIHGHFVRALIESTAATVLSLVRRISSDRVPGGIVATGGGANNSFWLQVIADMTGICVYLPTCPEAACLGAGMFAAVAADWFPDLQPVAEEWPVIGMRFDPDERTHARYRSWYERYQELTAGDRQ